MRLMVMFDLPVDTSEDRRNYRRCRKALINEGFLMIQYSVYARVCLNRNTAKLLEGRISSFAPANGVIQTFMMTEKQYNDMHFLSGKPKDDVRNTDDGMIII